MYIDWITWSIWLLGLIILVVWIYVPYKEFKNLLAKHQNKTTSSKKPPTFSGQNT